MHEDKNAGPVVSALVLVAATLFTANVYMMYSRENQVAMYEEAESSYSQAASVFLSIKAIKAEQATTTEEVIDEAGPVLE